jgi:hypothetical protein
MRRDFKIKRGVEIWKDDIFVDLHNLYYLSDISFLMASALLTVCFSRNKYPKPQSISLPSKTIFVFTTISYLEISKGVLSGGANQLEEIGYKDSNDQNMDWLVTEDKSSELNHVVFRFQDDEFIRVDCENARFNCIYTGL